MTTAEECIRSGDVAGARAALTQEVRSNAADAKRRVFLFQLLCVDGDWDKALTQLNVAADLDPSNLLMAEVGRQCLQCEALRAKVFAGERTPLILGEPAEWISWMLQALKHTAAGEHAAAAGLRDRAFEAAPAVSGEVDGVPFEWIADADMRLGPIAEAIVEGRYYWVPFSNIRELRVEEPTDLRDVVWAPCEFTWVNGGKAVAMMPVRYPGTEKHEEGAVRLARKTDFVQVRPEFDVCVGQRMWGTDTGEYAMLSTRSIVLHHPDAPAADGGDAGG